MSKLARARAQMPQPLTRAIAHLDPESGCPGVNPALLLTKGASVPHLGESRPSRMGEG